MFCRYFLSYGRAAIRVEVTTKGRKELGKLLSGGVQQVRVVLRAVALVQLAKGVAVTTADCGDGAADAAGDSQDRPSLSGRCAGTGSLREATGREPSLCWRTVRSSGSSQWSAPVRSGGLRPVDGATGGRGSGQKRRLATAWWSRETIRILLLSHDLKPWREKNVVVRRDKPAGSRG